MLLEAMREQGPDSRLLLLVSGGASALVEALRAGHSLDELQSLTVEWLAGGLSISQINANRAERSRVKAGKLLREFRGSELRVYAISDVEGDDISIIGSGIGDTKLSSASSSVKIIASNAIARDAAARFATDAGYRVQINDESLYGNVSDVAAGIVQTLLKGEAGVYIWGGEPVVHLPDHPGIGGRNQSLALSVAMGIKGRHGISVIAAGSDGVDGVSDAAGGIVDSATVDDTEDARHHLERANAGTWLATHGAAFVTGPTDTNVMDLVVAIVGNSSRA
jgi:hydroxypyruvate reductase